MWPRELLVSEAEVWWAPGRSYLCGVGKLAVFEQHKACHSWRPLGAPCEYKLPAKPGWRHMTRSNRLAIPGSRQMAEMGLASSTARKSEFGVEEACGDAARAMSERRNTSRLAELACFASRRSCDPRSVAIRSHSASGQLTCIPHIWTNRMTRSESTHLVCCSNGTVMAPRAMHFYCFVLL